MMPSEESSKSSSPRTPFTPRLGQIYIVPLDEQGEPVSDKPSMLTRAEFETNFLPNEDSSSIPLLADGFTQTLEMKNISPTDPDLMKLIFGEPPPQPHWVLKGGGHTIDAWNLRVGERDPETGKIPYHFDGQYLCGPHDHEGNHI